MAVNITKKPTSLPSSLVLKRNTENGNAAIEANWKNPAAATDENRNDRWQQVEERWDFNASKNMAKSYVTQNGWTRKIADKLFITGQGVHTRSCQYYTRSKYHPLTNGRYLNSVTCGLWSVNSKGWIGKVASTYTFQKPRKPTITLSPIDPETGIITTTIKTDPGNDAYERYDTYFCITRQVSWNDPKYKTEQLWYGWYGWRSTEFELRNDWGNLAIMPGEWIRFRAKAYARGLKGNSETVVAEHIFAYPAVGSISNIRVSSLNGAGVVVLSIKTNSSTYAPVDSVKLQRLGNTTIATAASAATADGWEDVEGAEDNATGGVGFTDQVVNALPDVKKHTWYRLVTKHDLLTRTSIPVEAKVLYRDKDQVGDDKINFASVVAGDDGESVRMLIGWKNDDSNNTEVTWSEYEDAWESNKQPESITLSWEDSTSQIANWAHSAHVTIRGLEEGKPCYIRARRFLDDGNGITYGPWCTPAKEKYPVTASTTPDDVVLSAPAFIGRGRDLTVTWAFGGELQTGWTLYYLVGSKKYVLASGDDPSSAVTVPASKLERFVSLNLRVSVSTGGTWVDSGTVVTKIVEPPELTVSTNSTLTAQPMEISMHSSVSNASITAYLTASAMSSGGVSSDSPSGVLVQAAGDVVWADVLQPAWDTAYKLTEDVEIDSEKTYYVLEDGDYVAVDEPDVSEIATYYETDGFATSYTLPMGLNLYDGGTYDISAVSTDPSTNLPSNESIAQTSIAWSHQAEPPASATSLAVDQEELRVTMSPVEPSNAEESATYPFTIDEEIDEDKTYYVEDGGAFVPVQNPDVADIETYHERVLSDVCDIYRVTMDGAVLVAQDVVFGTSVTDYYAPYSDRESKPSYRICTRTADGDLAWNDFDYTLRHDGLRLDWGSSHVDLPYNVRWSIGWQKRFSLSNRWDGSNVGQWDGGSTRSEKLTTDVIRVESWETSMLLSELARHDGPCFVRTSIGEAYQANVEVNDYSGSHENAAIAVSIDATETDLTDEFMIGAPIAEMGGE